MTPSEPAATVQATYCATLVDEWVRRGVAHAVVAPGSRSTPMALAIAARDDLAVHVVHDERAAAFVALGLGLTGRPALLLCTSGTAAVNFHPAVVEAGLSDVPMLVLTADRPPELIGVGAPQAIDQAHLFGGSVRWFHDPGVPAAAEQGSWRALAARSLAAAASGPVHLNLPFRDPLLGPVGALPAAAVDGVPNIDAAPRPAEDADDAGAAALLRGRGIIVAGGRSGITAEAVAELAARSGWPVLADPTSGCRSIAGAVAAFDVVLRDTAFAATHRPDVVVRVGRPPASKVLSQWIVASGAPVVQVGGPGTIDPDGNVVRRLDALPTAAVAPAGDDWLDDWVEAGVAAESHIEQVLAQQPALTEPAVARTIATVLPPDAELVVASSMPVRDLEWYGGPAARAHANRGANGIDGTMSTALGLALSGRTVVVLLGDIAFVHDAGALTALRRRGVDLRVVVVDNDGGGIFSFLPQATALDPARFEQLFGTPHGTDLVALAAAHGLDAATVTTAAELIARVGRRGPHVTRVATDRAANVAVHAAVNAWRAD